MEGYYAKTQFKILDDVFGFVTLNIIDIHKCVLGHKAIVVNSWKAWFNIEIDENISLVSLTSLKPLLTESTNAV